MQQEIYEKLARQHRLTLVSKSDLTVRRLGAAAKPRFMCKSKPVARKRALQLSTLVVPPAWKKVRFALADRAHIQAIGEDAKQRRQYIYHERWTDLRNEIKAERMRRFGATLPAIREKVAADLKLPVNTKAGMLATAVRLIDRHHIRAGYEKYVKNGTVGTATLRSKHLRVTGKTATLKFKAKSAKKAVIEIDDPDLIERLQALRQTGSKRLFSFSDNGSVYRMNATAMNEYLAEIGREGVSVKDFRTFCGSALALETLISNEDIAQGRMKATAAREVADTLRNTPAVAKSSYILPAILDAHDAGKLDPGLMNGRVRSGLTKAETAFMRFLEKA